MNNKLYKKLFPFYIFFISNIICQNICATEIPSTLLTFAGDISYTSGRFEIPRSISIPSQGTWVLWTTGASQAQSYWKGTMSGSSPRKDIDSDRHEHYTFGSFSEIFIAVAMATDTTRRVRKLNFHTTRPDSSHIRWEYDVNSRQIRSESGSPSSDEVDRAKAFIEAWCEEANTIAQPSDFPKKK